MIKNLSEIEVLAKNLVDAGEARANQIYVLARDALRELLPQLESPVKVDGYTASAKVLKLVQDGDLQEAASEIRREIGVDTTFAMCLAQGIYDEITDRAAANQPDPEPVSEVQSFPAMEPGMFVPLVPRVNYHR